MALSMSEGRLILILGDQLSPALSSLAKAEHSSDVVLIAEVAEEATYVRHHKKKIAFLFSAMRHFSVELEQAGWHVDYVKLDDADNSGSLAREVQRALVRHRLSRVIVTEPGEWRLLTELKGWARRFDCAVEILPDTRFLANHQELSLIHI